MKMKLSKTGLERISKPILKSLDGHYDYAVVETLEDHVFESEDFGGVVVFELNDAKAILGAYKALAKIYEALEVPYAVESAQEAIATIEYRIAQAESSTK